MIRLILFFVISATAAFPLAAQQPLPTDTVITKQDTAKKPDPMPKMDFTAKYHDFGKIKKGDRPTYTYEFTNNGEGVLDIEIVTGCDCTELEYTEKLVKPGEKGFVKATFNSNRAEPEEIGIGKPVNKVITIVLKNTYPNGYPIVDELKFDVQIEK